MTNGDKCQSKSEALVGCHLLALGYKFEHDKKYNEDEKYKNLGKEIRYDFKILNKHEPTRTHLYIEVKDNSKDYEKEMEDKRIIVEEQHGDIFLWIYDKNLEFIKTKIESSMKRVYEKAELNKLKFNEMKMNNAKPKK